MDFVLYTPTWTAGGRPTPEIGNGDLGGWLDVDRQWAAIRLRVGSTTKLGDGAWQFSCPVESTDPTFFNADRPGVIRFAAVGLVGDGRLSMFVESKDEPVGPTCPFEWRDGDMLHAVAGRLPFDFRWQHLAPSLI